MLLYFDVICVKKNYYFEKNYFESFCMKLAICSFIKTKYALFRIRINQNSNYINIVVNLVIDWLMFGKFSHDNIIK